MSTSEPIVSTRRRWAAPIATVGTALAMVLLLIALIRLVGQWDESGVRFNAAIAGVALALGLVYWILGGIAWWVTLQALGRAAGTATERLGPTLRVFFVGNVGRYLPGKLWYAASRAYLADRQGMNASAVAGSTVLELALIATSGAVVTLSCGPFLALVAESRPAGAAAIDPQPVTWLGAAGFALGLLGLHPRVLRVLLAGAARLRGALPPPPPSYGAALGLLLIYVGVWTVAGLALFATVAAVAPITWLQLPAVIGVWGIAYLAGFIAPFTPAGIGVREATASFLLATMVPLPQAIAAALAFRLVLTATEAALVVPLALRSGMMLRRAIKPPR